MGREGGWAGRVPRDECWEDSAAGPARGLGWGCERNRTSVLDGGSQVGGWRQGSGFRDACSGEPSRAELNPQADEISNPPGQGVDRMDAKPPTLGSSELKGCGDREPAVEPHPLTPPPKGDPLGPGP